MAKRKVKKSKAISIGLTASFVAIGVVLLAWFVIPAMSPPPRPGAIVQVPQKPVEKPPEQVAVLPPPHPKIYEEPAWRKYAVKVSLDGRPMIAIVLDDMGLDERRAMAAITLPAPLTMSYMTYARNLPAQAAAARARGHELMLHIPMEPLGHVDPGPNTLEVDLPDDTLRERLQWDLSRLDGIVGVNNHMGSRFTESAHDMSLVMDALQPRGLFFLDSRTTAKTVGAATARERGLPYAERQVFLDDDQGAPAIAAMLARTEAVARRQGAVIAIGHPHDATVAALRDWLPLVAEHGFQLVPVSAIVMRNLGNEPHAMPVSD